MRRLALGALALVLLLTGCSAITDLRIQPVGMKGCGDPHGIVLIIGSHKNAPAPSLGQDLMCQITAAIGAGKPIRIVVVSGQPFLVTPRLVPVSGGTLAQQNSPRGQEDLHRIQAAVKTAHATSPGIDDLAGLSMAADAARSAGAPHAELALLDSGLDERGALDFMVSGMIGAAPREVARELAESGNLPNLRGFSVLLVGIGYTAAPQPPLAAKWRSSLTRIWAAVVSAAGATVQIIPQPAQGRSVKTSQPVRLVPVPSNEPIRPSTRAPIVFTGASPVRFMPNSTVFIDEVAATIALRPIARWLAADWRRRASLVGTTADVGPMSGQVELSRLRADRVRDELIALGARAAQISVKGVGSDFPEFMPDRSGSGVLLAGPATLNRSVRITLKSS